MKVVDLTELQTDRSKDTTKLFSDISSRQIIENQAVSATQTTLGNQQTNFKIPRFQVQRFTMNNSKDTKLTTLRKHMKIKHNFRSRSELNKDLGLGSTSDNGGKGEDKLPEVPGAKEVKEP